MENQIKFFHCAIKVDFRDTDYSPLVVRKAVIEAALAEDPPFFEVSEAALEPLENHPLMVRKILALYRKFLHFSRRFKVQRHG